MAGRKKSCLADLLLSLPPRFSERGPYRPGTVRDRPEEALAGHDLPPAQPVQGDRQAAVGLRSPAAAVPHPAAHGAGAAGEAKADRGQAEGAEQGGDR